MSAISDFSSTSPASSTDDAFNTLSSAEFLQIIFTELQNQDPLEPQDSQAMLNQLSSLRSIESDTKMVDSLQNLVSQNEFAAASQLIGSLVSGITLDNQRAADLVISVSQTSEGPVLNLFGGGRMFFDQVDEIAGPIDDYVDPDDGDTPTDPDPDVDAGVDTIPPIIGDADDLDADLDHSDSPSDSPTRPVVTTG
jgi:flagellar basal-body rod modification protein FlgD|tara:strand:- start:1363 stop:1947 length:585 start_codon:yes stop_codon:yes gene_type:complete